VKRVASVLLILLVTAPMLGATAGAQVTEQPADLAVDQPDYVSEDVTRGTTNGTPVYTVHAGEVDLKPQNFGNGSVVGYGVDTSAGSLTYDEAFDVFRFDAEGNVGTFELYWEVEEQRTVQVNNSTEVQTIRTRYTAVIRVAENPQYSHVPASEIQQDEAAAENWSEWEGPRSKSSTATTSTSRPEPSRRSTTSDSRTTRSRPCRGSSARCC